ncbi:MAG: nucleotide exchange factor GrpE [Austwickia sp.]|jgi:molecular chaperone GrpE|nr:MAG: nucleotide exchange factor GrpE [Austwickia sp.]
MSENHTPAQQAAARGAYEDVQASTGGESKVPPPQSADPIQGVDPEANTEATPPAGDDSPATAVPTEESPELTEAPLGDAAQAPTPGTQAADAPAAQAASGSDAQLAAERLADLQRLQAEYVNYKRRVDRDRAVESERAIAGFVEALLPVMDEIHLARLHGDLETGPFAKIAEKFEGVLAKYGVQRYGEPGETFDPMVHEAVMHVQAELAPGTTEMTVVQIMQPGYRIGDRLVRPAMVAVADPS